MSDVGTHATDAAALPSGRTLPTERSTGRISLAVLIGFVRLADPVVLGVAGSLGVLARSDLRERWDPGVHTLIALIGMVIACAALGALGSYRYATLVNWRPQSKRLIAALVPASAAVALCTSVATDGGCIDWTFTLAWVTASALALVLARLTLMLLVAHWCSTHRLARRIAVIGAPAQTREFLAECRFDSSLPTQMVGIFANALPASPGSPAGAGVADLLALGREFPLDAVVIAASPDDHRGIGLLRDQLCGMLSDVYFYPGFESAPWIGANALEIDGARVVPMVRRPMDFWQSAQKLVLDYLLAAALMVVFFPLCALIACLIRLDSPGPILFKQARIGFNNRRFFCYKFRTMYWHLVDPQGDRQATRDDPRVTRVGYWLRRLSLDELPQLINVMRGEMSLVGPRPHAENTKVVDRRFDQIVPYYAARHRVKPGITGWAQVNGWRGETRTEDQLWRRIECDLRYIEHWSIALDLRILILTLLREVISKRAF